MEINFRYRILQKLGEGGNSTVFLSEDSIRNNVHCAFKILHPPVDVAGSDALFRNEVSILAGLNHPNLVRILDFGIIGSCDDRTLIGRRFFTMEYIEGKDALTWIRGAGDRANKLRLIELLFLQSLSVAAHVHREGVIHFDIKPENLIVLGDQAGARPPLVKLADFGFSVKASPSQEIPIRGTLEYTAPELLRGETCDHRADLYSLGATFFQLLEDHCPFEAETPVELIKKVLNDQPTFSQPNEPASRRLREVIATLLQKEPALRFATGKDAALHLLADRPAMLEPYFGFARKPRFVGREEEKRTMGKEIDRITSRERVEPGVTVLVQGPEGVGKSALLREMVTIARGQGLCVVQADTLSTHTPFAALSPVVAILRSEAQTISGDGRTLVAQFDASGAQGESRVLEEGSSLDKRIEQFGRFLVNCSSLFPILVVADDIGAIDAASRKALESAAQEALRSRLLLLCSRAAQNSFQVPRESCIIQLGELSEREVVEMSLSMFDSPAMSMKLGHRLYELYGGVPAIITEALNALSEVVPPDVAQSEIKVQEFLDRLDLLLPKSIDEFLLKRYEKLNPERKLILDVLSSFDAPTPVELLSDVLPFRAERILQNVRNLELEGFVAFAEGGKRLAIRLGRLKDVIYTSTREHSTALHALIAPAMERRLKSPPFPDLAELGHQWEHAGESSRAVSWYERAGDAGVALLALERSLSLYARAADLARQCHDSETEFRIRGKMAETMFQSGAYKDTIILVQELQTQAEYGAAHSRLLKVMGLSESRLGQFDAARQHLTEALRSLSDVREAAELRQELSAIEIATGHFVDAEQSSRTQLREAEGFADDRLTGMILTDLGIATFLQDRFDDAVSYFHKAMERYLRAGLQVKVVDALMNVGNALSAKGDVEQAIVSWQHALELARESGTLNQQAGIQNNLGIAHFNLKKFVTAKGFYAEARKLYERINSQSGTALVLSNLGEVCFAEGEYQNALQHMLDAHALYTSMQDSRGLVEASLRLANLWILFGDLEAAEQYLEAAGREIECNQLTAFEGELNFVQGLLRRSRGDLATAGNAFGAAKERFVEAPDLEKRRLCVVKIAESLMELGNPDAARTEVTNLLTEAKESISPMVLAEAYYLMGRMATGPQKAGSEPPIVHFKKGMNAIAQEPVGELTWRLAYALGIQHQERGQLAMARQYFIKTKVVLQYFMSQITSLELRNRYLSVDNRQLVLSTIDRLLQS